MEVLFLNLENKDISSKKIKIYTANVNFILVSKHLVLFHALFWGRFLFILSERYRFIPCFIFIISHLENPIN